MNLFDWLRPQKLLDLDHIVMPVGIDLTLEDTCLGLLRLYFQDKGVELKVYPAIGESNGFKEDPKTNLEYNLEFLTQKGDLVQWFAPMPTQAQNIVNYFGSRSKYGRLSVKYQGAIYEVPINLSSACLGSKTFKKMVLKEPFRV